MFFSVMLCVRLAQPLISLHFGVITIILSHSLNSLYLSIYGQMANGSIRPVAIDFVQFLCDLIYLSLFSMLSPLRDSSLSAEN